MDIKTRHANMLSLSCLKEKIRSLRIITEYMWKREKVRVLYLVPVHVYTVTKKMIGVNLVIWQFCVILMLC